MFGLDVSEKTQAAEVDADNGDAMRREVARHVEQRAVAADDDGQFYLAADGTALAPGTPSAFTVDLRNLKSDQSRRDSRVQEALETGNFPTAAFAVSEVTGFDPSIPEGQEQSLQMTGTLDLHGVQREVVWDVKARREATVITALATVNFRYDNFGITAPNIAGIVSVEDNVTLQVQIVAVEV